MKQLVISQISGWISSIRPYRISGSEIRIRPVTGYQKRPDYPAGYLVHPYLFVGAFKQMAPNNLVFLHN
jgi:hypothetical protein